MAWSNTAGTGTWAHVHGPVMVLPAAARTATRPTDKPRAHSSRPTDTRIRTCMLLPVSATHAHPPHPHPHVASTHAYPHPTPHAPTPHHTSPACCGVSAARAAGPARTGGTPCLRPPAGGRCTSGRTGSAPRAAPGGRRWRSSASSGTRGAAGRVGVVCGYMAAREVVRSILLEGASVAACDAVRTLRPHSLGAPVRPSARSGPPPLFLHLSVGRPPPHRLLRPTSAPPPTLWRPSAQPPALAPLCPSARAAGPLPSRSTRTCVRNRVTSSRSAAVSAARVLISCGWGGEET